MKKRMKKRKRVPESTLSHERLWVSEFTLNSIVEQSGGKLAIHDIFDSYCDWLARRELGPSKLSVDGFGRLFPKHFKRATAMLDGGTRKCVFDVKVLR